MVIVVRAGDSIDPTIDPAYYDPIFGYLKSIGMDILK